jgi:hypothetical protein
MNTEEPMRSDSLLMFGQSQIEKLKDIPFDTAILYTFPWQEFQFSFENLQVADGFSFV